MTAHYFWEQKKMVIWGVEQKSRFWFSKVKGQEVNLIIENTAKKSLFFYKIAGEASFLNISNFFPFYF